MKSLKLILVLFVVYPNLLFAQIENVQMKKDLTEKNGILYFNGTPYTGEAIKFDGAKFDKTKLRFDGHYVNGYPNGSVRQWYSNYKLEYEENYTSGVKDGNQFYYYENGNKKSVINFANGKLHGAHTEWFSNGKEKTSYTYNAGTIADGKYTIYFENGMKAKEETYSGGKKISEGNYKNGELYESVLEYYPGGRVKKIEGFTKNGLKDSLWVEWYENGEKRREEKFKNGKLDSLLYENNVDPVLSINSNLKPGSYLFRSLSGMDDDTVYVMVTLNFEQRNDYEQLSANIITALHHRFELMNKEEESAYGKKMLAGSIEFYSPSVSTFYDNGQSSTDLGIGTLRTQVTPGYRGMSSVSMKVSNLKSDFVVFDNRLSAKSEIYSKQDYASSVAPSVIRQEIINKIYQTFKIKTQVSEIVETDRKGKAKTIRIMCGSNLSLAKGFMFFIYPDANNMSNSCGKVKVIEVLGEKSICKVMEGEETITDLIQSGKKLIAVSAY